jgi:uncharacterized protein YkwD
MNVQESRRVMRPCVLFCLCCALAACGGGSEDVSVNGTAPMPTPVANSTLPAAPVPAPVTASTGIDASCGLNGAAGIEAEVLQRVNAFRAAGAVCGSTIYAAAAPLNWNSLLLQAASDHSTDMAQHDYFSHDSLDGKTFAERLTDVGYSYTAAGENIAANDPTVESVLTHWLYSPAHCANMMNATYRDIGVACVRSDSATYGRYWTMDLGRS